MGIPTKPSQAVDPIMDGAIQMAAFVAEHCEESIESIRCHNNGSSMIVSATEEGGAKKPYLLMPYDKDHKKREQQVCEATIEKEVAARVTREIATRFPGGPAQLGRLYAQDLASYCFNPDAPVDMECDQMIYEGFLSPGDLACWIGREKARKSNFVLQLAICAAVGRDFLNFKFTAQRPMTTVIIDYESNDGNLQKRYKSLAAEMNLSEADRTLLKANLTILEVRRIRKSGLKFPKFPHTEAKATPEALAFWDGLVAAYPADIYIIDPFRSLHSSDENDSNIEWMLTELQRVFRGATLILPHHMRKPGENLKELVADMRRWSDEARGSSAIKACADVIVCQERTTKDNGDEVVYLGAFLKNGADVEPFATMESNYESFYFERGQDIPDRLTQSVEALGLGNWRNKSEAADIIRTKTGTARATAYRHLTEMVRMGIITVLPGGRLERKLSNTDELAA